MEEGILKTFIQIENARCLIVANARISDFRAEVAHSGTLIVRIITQNDLIAALIVQRQTGLQRIRQGIGYAVHGNHNRKITGCRSRKELLHRFPVEIAGVPKIIARPRKRQPIGKSGRQTMRKTLNIAAEGGLPMEFPHAHIACEYDQRSLLHNAPREETDDGRRNIDNSAGDSAALRCRNNNVPAGNLRRLYTLLCTIIRITRLPNRTALPQEDCLLSQHRKCIRKDLHIRVIARSIVNQQERIPPPIRHHPCQIRKIPVKYRVQMRLPGIQKDMVFVVFHPPRLPAPRHHQDGGEERVARHIVLLRKRVQLLRIPVPRKKLPFHRIELNKRLLRHSLRPIDIQQELQLPPFRRVL